MDGIKSFNKTDEVIHRHTYNFMDTTLDELLTPIDAALPTRPTLPNDKSLSYKCTDAVKAAAPLVEIGPDWV